MAAVKATDTSYVPQTRLEWRRDVGNASTIRVCQPTVVRALGWHERDAPAKQGLVWAPVVMTPRVWLFPPHRSGGTGTRTEPSRCMRGGR